MLKSRVVNKTSTDDFENKHTSATFYAWSYSIVYFMWLLIYNNFDQENAMCSFPNCISYDVSIEHITITKLMYIRTSEGPYTRKCSKPFTTG